MKIKKVESICKKVRQIILFDGKNEQWAGCVHCLYALPGMPFLDEETVLRVFDMDDVDKYTARHIDNINGICLEDTVSDEIAMSVNNNGVLLGDTECLALMSEIGAFLIPKNMVLPVMDMPALNYNLRQGSKGYYIAVKSGFLLVAIIMPMRVNDDIKSQIRDLAACLCVNDKGEKQK